MLKLDLKGYFMAINKDILYGIILRTVRKTGADRRAEWPTVDYLLRKTIYNDPTKGCRIKGSPDDWKGLPEDKSLFHTRHGCGLPIGNVTSQLFSTIYLDILDQYCKRTLKCRHYGRYVDDFYIVGDSKESLRRLVPPIRAFLKEELALTLHPRKIWLHRQEEGVPFLGTVLSNGKRTMSRRGRKKMNEKLTLAMACENNPFRVRECVNAYEGYTRKFNRGGRKWFRDRGTHTDSHKKIKI